MADSQPRHGKTWGPLRDIAAQTKIWDRPRIFTAAHLRGEPDWWRDQLILGAATSALGWAAASRPATACGSRRTAAENWRLFHLDDETEDTGYGDMLYECQ